MVMLRERNVLIAKAKADNPRDVIEMAHAVVDLWEECRFTRFDLPGNVLVIADQWFMLVRASEVVEPTSVMADKPFHYYQRQDRDSDIQEMVRRLGRNITGSGEPQDCLAVINLTDGRQAMGGTQPLFARDRVRVGRIELPYKG